jgi:glutamate N-acetyltransferase/amino-acid N-acetyltransferase
LGIIAVAEPCLWAGTFTQNLFKAACVTQNQALQDQLVSGVVINSGNANCATGRLGAENDLELRKLAAKFAISHTKISKDHDSIQSSIKSAEDSFSNNTTHKTSSAPNTFLSASTGVIGKQLDMTKIAKALAEVKTNEMTSSDKYTTSGNEVKVACAPADLARAILTTDTGIKVYQDKNKHMLSFAKGSGMIAPNMATMLAFICCDCNIEGIKSNAELTEILKSSVNQSFNRISVDSDTSTNDMVLLLNTASGKNISKSEFKQILDEHCLKLAKDIIKDGEGATKVIHLKLAKLLSDENKLNALAKNIINSPLVKTAIFGNDPNWGRLAMAFGKAHELFDSVDFTAENLSIKLLDTEIYTKGKPSIDGAELNELSRRMKSANEILIEFNYADLDNYYEFWGNDLSYDYVKINAEYTT